MQIRSAHLSDVETLVTMGAHFVAQTAYAKTLAMSPTHLRLFAERCLTGQMADSDILVSEDEEGITGMIGVILAPHPFSGEPVAAELFWWVEPAKRGHGIRLMHAAEAWATAHGATKFQMVAPNDRVARLYERRGYTRLEATFQRSLSCRQE